MRPVLCAQHVRRACAGWRLGLEGAGRRALRHFRGGRAKVIDHGVCGLQVGAREVGILAASGAEFRPKLEACGRVPSPGQCWRVEKRGCRGAVEATDPEVRAATLGRLPAARGPYGQAFTRCGQPAPSLGCRSLDLRCWKRV